MADLNEHKKVKNCILCGIQLFSIKHTMCFRCALERRKLKTKNRKEKLIRFNYDLRK